MSQLSRETAEQLGGMEVRRYVVSVNVTITAADEEEARRRVESALASTTVTNEADVVDVFAEDADSRDDTIPTLS